MLVSSDQYDKLVYREVRKCVCVYIYCMHLLCTTFVTIFYKVTGCKCNLDDGNTKRPVISCSCILFTKLLILEYNHMGNVAGLCLGGTQFVSLKWNSYCVSGCHGFLHSLSAHIWDSNFE